MLKHENSVFRVNVRKQGVSFVWRDVPPPPDHAEAAALLPRVEKEFGANLAYSCTRMSEDRYLLATVSRWNTADEFGRPGMSLSEGNLVTARGVAGARVTALCEHFLGLLRAHEQAYQTLGSLLENIARTGDGHVLRELVSTMGQSPDLKIDDGAAELVASSVRALKSASDGGGSRLRVYTEFPLPDKLGFCALIGLLADPACAAARASVGGGILQSTEGYRHVSTLLNAPGYEYFDLNRALAPGMAPARDRRVQEESHHNDENDIAAAVPRTGGARKDAWDKLSVLAPLISGVLIAGTGLHFVQSFNKKQDDLLLVLSGGGAAPKKAAATPETAASTPPAQAQPTPAADAGQDAEAEARLSRSIAGLFDDSRDTRVASISALRRETAAHQRMLRPLLAFAREREGNKNGIDNTLEVLRSVSPATLAGHRDELNAFLDLVKAKATAGGDQAVATRAEEVRNLFKNVR